MSQEQIDILQRKLKRERAARKAAEKILEHKSKELYITSKNLEESNIKLENLLNQKSSQLQGVFENIKDAYVAIELSGNVLKMNDAAIELFGFDINKEKLNVTNLIYEEDTKYAFESFKELSEKGFFSNYIARIITKSKDIRWVQINASLIFDTQKKPIGAQGIIRDITKERESKYRLIESENRLSALVLNLNSGIVLEDENRKMVLTNKKFCELFHIDAEPHQLIGTDCSEASEQNKILFKDPVSFVQRIKEIGREKKEVFGELLEMVDGKILERNYTPIILEGKTKGYLWTFNDVTLEKKYNLSLEAQKEKYSSIIANMNLGLIEVNSNDEILMVNNSFTKISGYSEEELIGKTSSDLFLTKESKKTILEESKKREKGESNSYEIKVRNKNGELRYWLISGAPNYNLNGKIIGSIGIHLDITELKSLELQKEKILKELEKSNSELYEYAHVVSHDLKSPLRSISALTSWIKSDNEDTFDENTLQNFDLIESTLETMENLISSILEYSSVGTVTEESENVDINATIENLKKILYIPKNIFINVVRKLPIIKGDATKFQQLFQNLISNAIKFSDKEKGIIEIDVAEKKTFYEFSVKDNGMGIEKKFHDKIFKIFHSLKKSKQSSGIGLSIVQKIVDLYGGKIWLESEPAKGTTFFFTIKKK